LTPGLEFGVVLRVVLVTSLLQGSVEVPYVIFIQVVPGIKYWESIFCKYSPCK
jgi:hypothetical protein